MNKHEFSALPPDLQRDVRLAVALGWPLESVRCDGETVDVRENRMAAFPWRRFDPTQSREIWAGLLEAFEVNIAPRGHSQRHESIEGYEVWIGCYWESCLSVIHEHLPTAIVEYIIRRDQLGHLGRYGL